MNSTSERQWFVADRGEQLGPLSEQDLVTQIRSGRWGESTLVWTEGMAAWTELHELAIFAQATRPAEQEPQSEVESQDVLHTTAPATLQPSPPDPFRRFLARQLDLLSFQYLLLEARALIPGVGPLEPVSFIVGSYLMWAVLEGIMLPTLGFTPGKWLMQVEVTDAYGRRLRFARSLRRAFDVAIRGTGLGLPVVNYMAKILGFYQLTGTGMTHWDRAARCVVTHRPLEMWRWILLIALTLLLAMEQAEWLGPAAQS